MTVRDAWRAIGHGGHKAEEVAGPFRMALQKPFPAN